MRKNIIIFILLLLVTGCNLFKDKNVSPQIPEELLIQKTITEETSSYLIQINYPQISLADKSKETKINQQLLQITNLKIANFKDAVTDVGDSNVPQLASTLFINFSQDFVSQDLVSLHFFIDTYIFGAVHGYREFLVYNYDIVNDRSIELKDLFYINSQYLHKISELATNQFNNQFGADSWFSDGVKPDSANFQNFVLTKESLDIYFGDYQVAPYAAGPQSISIKYAELNDLLTPEGPLKNLR